MNDFIILVLATWKAVELSFWAIRLLRARSAKKKAKKRVRHPEGDELKWAQDVAKRLDLP